MKFRANKMLGMAIGEKSILIAEVSTAGDKCQVTRAGGFGYTSGTTLQQPQALGEALAEFLKQEGYTAKAAVVGIPAKWVLTKLKELPPVDPTFAADMIRLQIESEFSAEIKDLVHDYAGQSDATSASQVLLAATPLKNVELVREMAKAAKLEVQALTATSVALSSATTGGRSDALVLSITPSGAELAAQRGASPSLLRHVGSSAAVTPNVAGEVRRAALLLPRNGASAGNGSANGHSQAQIVVWDDGIVDPAARATAVESLGETARSGEFVSLGAGDLPAGTPPCAAAVALAVAGITDAKLPVDFLHPRLAPPKQAAMKQRTVWAICVGAVIVLLLILMWFDCYRRQNALRDMQYDLETKKKRLKEAEPDIVRNEYARNWHASPRYLDCLRDLTDDFPADGRIFVTSFTMHDNMKGEIGGKSTASNEKSTHDLARDLADRLRNRRDRRFLDVEMKSVDKRQIKAGQEISFTITFRYVPAEPPQP